MHSPLRVVTAACIFSSSISGTFAVNSDDCNGGPMDGHKSHGNLDKPVTFCDTQWNKGLTVTGLEVWATQWQIKGIQLAYSDGTKPPLEGQAEGDRHGFINWKESDRISKMRLAINYAGDALGLVHVEVGGQTLDVRSDTGSFDGDDITLATGIFLGANGVAGGFVDRWTPLFMGKHNGKGQITGIVMDDNLNDLNAQQRRMKFMSMDALYIQNSSPAGGANQSWDFEGQQEKAQTSSLTTTTTASFGLTESIEIGASVGVPEIATVNVQSTTTMQWQYRDASAVTSSTTNTAHLTWKAYDDQHQLAPRHAANCTATTVQGTYNGGYTYTLEFQVNGKTFTMNPHGTFNSIGYTKSWASCEDVLISNIPSGASVRDGTPASRKRAEKLVATGFFV